MRHLVTSAALLALTGCSFGADVPLARTGVDALHAQLNGGKCPEIRENAATDFKQVSTVASWQTMCEALAAKLGKFVSLKETGWNDEAGTNGHIIRLAYDSAFEKGKAVEQFMFRIESGKAVLVGYHVNSDVFSDPPVAPPEPAPPKP